MNSVKRNWCTIPNYFFKKLGGLSFLLRCSYDTKYLNDLPIFYKTILDNFYELKSLYSYYQKQDIIPFNNKEILTDGKPIFPREWFNKGIISIVDFVDESGNLLTSQEFSRIYPFQTNFLQYYQVISAIPKHLLSKAKESDTFNKNFFVSVMTTLSNWIILYKLILKTQGQEISTNCSPPKLIPKIKPVPSAGVKTYRYRKIPGGRSSSHSK